MFWNLYVQYRELFERTVMWFHQVSYSLAVKHCGVQSLRRLSVLLCPHFMSSFYVFILCILCLHFMSSFYVFILCLHFMYSFYVFVLCLHFMYLFYVFILCIHFMSSFYVFILCIYFMSSFYVFILCLPFMSSFYVFILEKISSASIDDHVVVWRICNTRLCCEFSLAKQREETKILHVI